MNNLSGQISELFCQVFFLAAGLPLSSAFGIGRERGEIAFALARGNKSPRNKGRAFANSDR